MKLLLAALICSLPSIGNCQSLETCKTIENDDTRLACYDLALGVKSSASETGTSQNSKWIKHIETSKLTDQTNVFLSVLSSDEVQDKYGLGSAPAVLYLRCMENTTAVVLKFNDHFMASIAGGGRVDYRLDDAPMAKKSFQESNDNMALGLWSGGSSIPFIKQMFGHKQLIVRATPFNESSITVKFPISGIDEEITELRKTCGW